MARARGGDRRVLRGLTHRQRHPNDHVCRSRGNGEGEELTHRAPCGTERAHQRLSQRQRSVSGIDRGITPTAGQRAGAKHARARCLPPLLDGGLRASAWLKLAVVDSAKQAHNVSLGAGRSPRRPDRHLVVDLTCPRADRVRAHDLAGADRWMAGTLSFRPRRRPLAGTWCWPPINLIALSLPGRYWGRGRAGKRAGG